MAKDISYPEFKNMFPNEEEALQKLFNSQRDTNSCPSCKKQTKYYRVCKRRCFECGRCGHQIYPCKDTIMENSKVSVLNWLLAIHLTVQEPLGLSSTKLASALGITYKAAWALNHKIRKLMKEQPRHKLFGVVEIDETYCGGKKKAPEGANKIGYNGRENKIEIVGLRQGSGEVRTFYVDNPTKEKINKLITSNVAVGTTIYTDESALYKDLNELGYKHATVNHSKFQWANGKVTTNRIEGIWSKLKRVWRGVYVHLSKKHIESYLNEFNFKRSNCKITKREKFNMLMNRLFSCCDNLSLNS